MEKRIGNPGHIERVEAESTCCENCAYCHEIVSSIQLLSISDPGDPSDPVTFLLLLPQHGMLLDDNDRREELGDFDGAVGRLDRLNSEELVVEWVLMMVCKGKTSGDCYHLRK